MGPIGIVPARPISAGPALLQPDTPRYPAYLPNPQPTTMHHLSVPMLAGDHLAISNLAFAFMVDPQVTVRINGQAVAATAQDRVTAVYPCAGCAPGASVTAELDISSGAFADVDVVLF